MFKRKKFLIIIAFVFVVCLVAMTIYFLTKSDNTNEQTVEKNENFIEEEEINQFSEEIFQSEVDMSAIKVEEKTEQKIENYYIEKSGDTTDVAASDRMGQNSAVFVQYLASLEANNLKVLTNGKGASGFAVTGPQGTLTINNTEIITQAERSKGVLAVRNGTIVAENLRIKTLGYKSSAIATDFGGGNILVKNSTIQTEGEDSTGTYATGSITVEDSTIETKNAEGGCIDGSGSITLKNVYLTSYKKRGVMVYHTGPSHVGTTTGKVSITGGSLTVKEGPAFYIMNTEGIINLENVEINTDSGIFLQASVDEFGELGQEGKPVESKGGNANVVLKKQKIQGDIIVDSKSTLELTLEENSTFIGKIDEKNQSNHVKITLKEGCTWTLTGDSYVSSLDVSNESTQINLNGYNLYYKNQ